MLVSRGQFIIIAKWHSNFPFKSILSSENNCKIYPEVYKISPSLFSLLHTGFLTSIQVPICHRIKSSYLVHYMLLGTQISLPQILRRCGQVQCKCQLCITMQVLFLLKKCSISSDIMWTMSSMLHPRLYNPVKSHCGYSHKFLQIKNYWHKWDFSQSAIIMRVRLVWIVEIVCL